MPGGQMPGGQMPGKPPMEPLCIAACACGGASVPLSCCCAFLGAPLAIAGIVLGIIGMSKLGKEPGRFADNSKILAIIGIAAGGVGMLLTVASLIFGFSRYAQRSLDF